MGKSIEEERQRITLKKSRLEAKEKLLKQEDRKLHNRRLIEIGTIVSKAGVKDMDNNALLGALLEIKERSSNELTMKEWFENGRAVFQKEIKEIGEALIISFNSEPSKEAKKRLKELRFAWNNFRKEWYGYGKKKELEDIFVGLGAIIECAK